MCLTNHPENRIPFEKPAMYNELEYELLLRNYEAGEKGFPWINSDMPNRKTDTNNRLGFPPILSVRITIIPKHHTLNGRPLQNGTATTRKG
jgi:hypothetical protein